MSKTLDADALCPDCGAHFSVTLYRTIWGEFPENRELVFSDTINVASCTNCAFRHHVEFSLLYVDMRRQFAVWYEPTPDPQVDRDARIYASMFGPDGFYATAPRISDWNDFKKVVIEFETGLREATATDPRNLKSPLEMLKAIVSDSRPIGPNTKVPDERTSRVSLESLKGIHAGTRRLTPAPVLGKKKRDEAGLLRAIPYVYWSGFTFTFIYYAIYLNIKTTWLGWIGYQIFALFGSFLWPIFWLTKLLDYRRH